jgi:type IV pilus assembly protein PilM
MTSHGGHGNIAHFYKDKPIFGFDVGHSSLKVMQLEVTSKQPHLVGYGSVSFDPAAITDGVIHDFESVAKSSLELFQHHLVGDVTTKRVIITIPTYRTFSRSLTLPKLSPKEMREAVNLEIEQYLPMPIDDMYLNYDIVGENKDGLELFAIAVPKKIVDSQLELMRILGLEVVGVEATIGATGRLFSLDPQSDIPTVLIDFGSLSADITIFDKKMVVTGTVPGGGEVFSEYIQKALGVTAAEAKLIKIKYGLGKSKKQREITVALEPVLDQLVREIKRMIRYYDQHIDGEHPINQVVTFGGGANMPGLTDYLTDHLRLAVRTSDPWEYCNYRGLKAPPRADKSMFATAMGLGLAKPGELFV